MDDISRKREALFAAYPGRRWRDRVMKMSDSQVVAVYMRLQSQGKV